MQVYVSMTLYLIRGMYGKIVNAPVISLVAYTSTITFYKTNLKKSGVLKKLGEVIKLS